jgi:hypothetical protein
VDLGVCVVGVEALQRGRAADQLPIEPPISLASENPTRT